MFCINAQTGTSNECIFKRHSNFAGFVGLTSAGYFINQMQSGFSQRSSVYALCICIWLFQLTSIQGLEWEWKMALGFLPQTADFFFFHTSIELNCVQWWAKRQGKVSRQRKEKQNSTSYCELLATRTSCGRDGSAWSLWHTLTEPHQTFRFLLFCFPNFLRLENTPCLSFISLSS